MKTYDIYLKKIITNKTKNSNNEIGKRIIISNLNKK